jgi:hypothetical protein
LTDSLTDNVNATLSIIPGEIFAPDTVYLLWERSSDLLSTAIYARNLATMGSPFLVAGQANAHFRHPHVFRRCVGDTLFYFSYETNMNGNWDIYYSVMMKNETILGPFPFIHSSQNERSINFGSDNTFTWEKEGKIYVKDMTGDTVWLAYDSCSNPVIWGEEFVAYEMITTGQSGVFFSHYNMTTHTWSGPLPLDVYGTNLNPTFGNDSYATAGPYLFWRHKNGPYWEIEGAEVNLIEFCPFNNFDGANNLSPSFCMINYITDKAYPIYVNYFTFASDTSGNMEIYVNDVMGDTTYRNLSQFSGQDVHPQLYNHFHQYGYGFVNHVYDIWESYRGGHWQLWASNMDIITGEKTLASKTSGSLRCLPNPFTDEIRIEYATGVPGNPCIEIKDLNGKIIRMLNSAVTDDKHYVTWNGNDASGTTVPAGIYFCTVKTGDTVLRCKIIRQ